MTEALPVCGLLVLALYFPSTAASGMTPMAMIGFALGVACLVLLSLRRNGTAGILTCTLLAMIVPLLVCFTSFQTAPVRAGSSLGYASLSLLFALNLRDVRVPQLNLLWHIVNCINFVLGFGTVLGIERINNFIIAGYGAAYDSLVPTMLQLHKPVLTFATHSIAAFFLYLFFWANFEAFKSTGKKLQLVVAIGYLVLVGALLSVSGVLLFVAGMGQMALYAWSKTRHKTVLSLALAIVLVPVLTSHAVHELGKLVVSLASDVLSNPLGGFLGRFSDAGTLNYDLHYLPSHFFTPMGFGYREGIMFADCGPMEYLIRGSLPLLLLVYGGLWAFLRRSLIAKSDAIFLFWATVIFEIGMSILATFRPLFLLPVFVVYLNGLRGSLGSEGNNRWPPAHA